MWLVRLLMMVVIAFLVFFAFTSLAATFSRWLRPGTGQRKSCPKCHDTGWIAVEGSTQRACECGMIRRGPPGKVIDIQKGDEKGQR